LHWAKESLLKPPIVGPGREHEGRSDGRNYLCLPGFPVDKGLAASTKEISTPHSLVHCALFHYGQRSSNLILKSTYPGDISSLLLIPSSHFQHCDIFQTYRERQKQSNMCIKYRFYHLCGHTHRITTFPCTYTPKPIKLHPLPEDRVESSSPGSIYCPLICLSDPADSPEETRLFPTLCAKCEQVGVISEWLHCTPGGRFEVIRAWNKTHRPELRK
jgi:hypothetical protein